jgi:hypothetical protein
MENAGRFYGGHSVYFTYSHLELFVVFGYISSRFGMSNQEKSGNPDFDGQSSWPKIFFFVTSFSPLTISFHKIESLILTLY